MFESCNIFDFFCLCMPSHVEHSEGKLSHTVISHMVTLRIAYLLNEAVGQNLTREMVQTHSFYSLLYHVGIVPFAADESYEAVVLDAEKAKLLGVNAGNCAFYHQRLTRTEDGRIYEYTRSFIRGDRVRLDVHMQKSGMNFVRTID